MNRRRWIRLGVAGGGIAAGCVLLGAAIATDTLGAVDPHYRFASRWRATERIDLSMFDPKPTQAPVGAYSEILPWERWAPPPPEPRFVYDDPALLGPERPPPPAVRRAEAEPDLEADPLWDGEEVEPEPVLVEQAFATRRAAAMPVAADGQPPASPLPPVAAPEPMIAGDATAPAAPPPGP